MQPATADCRLHVAAKRRSCAIAVGGQLATDGVERRWVPMCSAEADMPTIITAFFDNFGAQGWFRHPQNVELS